MIELICQRETCKYCLYHKCENEEIKDEFKNISLITKVILNVSFDCCKRYSEDNSLIDPQS